MRSVPVPSSRVNCNSFLDLGTATHSFYLNSSEIGLAESLEVYGFLEQGLNLHVGEIDLAVRSEESVVITGGLSTFCLAVSFLGSATV